MPRDLFHSLPDGAAPAYGFMFRCTSEGAMRARANCETMWAEFHDLADAEFPERFPIEFHQRWFEMYLGVSLRRAGIKVTAPKPGPDLRIDVDRRVVWIEATVPTGGHPLHTDAVPTPKYRDANGKIAFGRVPTDPITLRVAHAFRQKEGKFVGYREKGLVGRADACVIAINVCDIPHASYDSTEYFLRAFYGVGDRFVAINCHTRQQVDSGRQFRDLLERTGGAVEDVAPLLREEYSNISAVLGSRADAGNVPVRFGDDFDLIPHAQPDVPLPRGLIPRGGEWVLEPDGEEGWRRSIIDHHRGNDKGTRR